MNLIIWLSPTILLALAVMSGRIHISYSALIGLLAAILVGFGFGNLNYDFTRIVESILRGGWIGIIILPYIMGGILFWNLALPNQSDLKNLNTANIPKHEEVLNHRRLLFTACFFVGPFAESATGFGVGILGTILLIKHLPISKSSLMIFGLLSQTLIPWGGMGSGTLVSSAYAKLPVTLLTMHTFPIITILMIVWLLLFWVTACRTDIKVSYREHLYELIWMLSGLIFLYASTYLLGPETAMLAAYGIFIVLRFLLLSKLSREVVINRLDQYLPFILVVSCLIVSRIIPQLKFYLINVIKLSPYPDLPSLSPLFHAGILLLFSTFILSVVRKQASGFVSMIGESWNTGKVAIITIFIFSMMAEVLNNSGISSLIATDLFKIFGTYAVVITPVISAFLGLLMNSGNAPNGLFMASQVSIATQLHLNVYSIAAIQHVAASSVGIFSPVRLVIVSQLTQGYSDVRSVKRLLFPFLILFLMIVIIFLVVLIQ